MFKQKKGKWTKKNRGGPGKPMNKPAAIPPQGCAHARQPHIASTMAFFLVMGSTTYLLSLVVRDKPGQGQLDIHQHTSAIILGRGTFMGTVYFKVRSHFVTLAALSSSVVTSFQSETSTSLLPETWAIDGQYILMREKKWSSVSFSPTLLAGPPSH